MADLMLDSLTRLSCPGGHLGAKGPINAFRTYLLFFHCSYVINVYFQKC